MISFRVLCVPVAQPRQRHRIIPGTQVMNFTPSKHPVQDFKASVRMSAQAAYQGPPLAGPIGVVIVFVMPRPGRLRWKTRPMPRCLHTSKPDLENVAKAFFDALTGIVWIDDAQIANANLSKVYADGDEQPCVEVKISEIENQ